MIIRVKTEKSYTVEIGSAVARSLPLRLRERLPKARKVAVVTDETVDGLYGGAVCSALASAGFAVERIVVVPGETSKNAETYFAVLRRFAAARLSRTDAVVALGGGTVGDLAGFAAATYLRGIAFVQMPTTLLAMVDSSVGGKTGIDLPEGKNLVGAFHQPAAVLCDTDFLKTLPADIRRDGFAEVIKYAVLFSRDLFDELNRPFDIDEIIARCVTLKRDCVERDEFDNGERRLLNLGHTFGHAIEKLSDYSLSHGRAVALGMRLITRTATAKGFCTRETESEINALLDAFGFTDKCAFPAEDLFAAMTSDKKTSGAAITLVVPVKIGSCRLVEVPLNDLPSWIAAAYSLEEGRARPHEVGFGSPVSPVRGTGLHR